MKTKHQIDFNIHKTEFGFQLNTPKYRYIGWFERCFKNRQKISTSELKYKKNV